MKPYEGPVQKSMFNDGRAASEKIPTTVYNGEKSLNSEGKSAGNSSLIEGPAPKQMFKKSESQSIAK